MTSRYSVALLFIILTTLFMAFTISADKSHDAGRIASDTLVYGYKALDHFVQLAGESKESLQIITCKLTSQKALETLVNAAQRGLDVDLIVDGNASRKAESFVDSAESGGVTIHRWNTKKLGKLHAKLYIFDRSSVMIGSFNLSKSAETSNFETFFHSRDKDVVDESLRLWRDLIEQTGG